MDIERYLLAAQVKLEDEKMKQKQKLGSSWYSFFVASKPPCLHSGCLVIASLVARRTTPTMMRPT